jgi:hypothetical protein
MAGDNLSNAEPQPHAVNNDLVDGHFSSVTETKPS